MKVLMENRRGGFNYEILEKFEAGIALNGQEVKSLKTGKGGLAGSYIILKDGEVFLIGMIIPAYQPKNAPSDYDQSRDRKLLLTKKEIDYLIGKTHQKGLTLVPLKMYTTKGKIKIEFGIGKGEKKIDKREKIKEREFKRQKERLMRESY